ncbi:MAG: AraC family transcriptional regulator, partial [bacterium]|nr:AraC family transcriptional regulator [bacterium]
MMDKNAHTLINPQNGNLAFKLFTFEDNSPFDHLQRLNYYSLIWIKKGKGTVKVDFSEYDFAENVLLAFAPYQPFLLQTEEKIEGVVLNFHPDFFCIHKHQAEVACNGILFNNIYEPPYVLIDEGAKN